MEACTIAIHTVEVFNYGFSVRQIARAIWALVIKPCADNLFIFFPVNSNVPVLADLATQFVKKHADQLVRHV